MYFVWYVMNILKTGEIKDGNVQLNFGNVNGDLISSNEQSMDIIEYVAQ